MALTADDFTMVWSEGVAPFPFVEDENCNITGYGHQDKAAFAAELNRYDDETGVDEPLCEEDRWTAAYISHQYVVLADDGESVIPADKDAEGAFPVTTMWGMR